MEKYMKFTMFKKETTDKKYHENPYRAVNFKRDGSGNLICPNGRKFHFKSRQNVYKNKYGRTEEIYECESCRTYADFLWLQPLQSTVYKGLHRLCI